MIFDIVTEGPTAVRRASRTGSDGPTNRLPVPQEHADETAVAAVARVHRLVLSDESPELMKRRLEIAGGLEVFLRSSGTLALW
jgi:hypothetical protein